MCVDVESQNEGNRTEGYGSIYHGSTEKRRHVNKVSLIAFTQNDIGNALLEEKWDGQDEKI